MDRLRAITRANVEAGGAIIGIPDPSPLSDAELALTYLEVDTTDPRAPYLENEVAARAGISPDESEQGLTPAAVAIMDAWATSPVARVMVRTESAYMREDYGDSAWRLCATFLFNRGHAEDEVVAILLSKHMRWADDSQGRGAGKAANSAAFGRYYVANADRGFDWLADGRTLAAQS